jgi:hypothetical protein
MENIKKTISYDYKIYVNYKEYAKEKGLNKFSVREGFQNAMEALRYYEDRTRFMSTYEIVLDDKEAFGYMDIHIVFTSEADYQKNKTFIDSYLDYILEPSGNGDINGSKIEKYSAQIEKIVLNYKLEISLGETEEKRQTKI